MRKKKVFISYCHKQGDWVWNRLVPCMRAGGADVRIDRERFEAGKALVGQMDKTQDAADVSILVLSPDYLKSRYCYHEMKRAIARDPNFQMGTIIPIKRVECSLPNMMKVKASKPPSTLLYVDLRNDKDGEPWEKLLQACEADLGASAPHWLSVRDEIIRHLKRKESLNLVVSGNPKWENLIDHLRDDLLKDLGKVDLNRGATASRRGLVEEILKACGSTESVPAKHEDLIKMDRILSARPISRLALLHFDMVFRRRDYGISDLLSALKHLAFGQRKLVLLVQSRTPIASLEKDYLTSPFLGRTQFVELKGVSE